MMEVAMLCTKACNM